MNNNFLELKTMQFFKYFFVFIMLSSAGFACDEIGVIRHINPDNSTGGFVGSSTKVNANAYISYNAKVCGKAWVDAGAKVLGQAVIKGNAWIREYSTVKDYASISDDAILWGTRNAPVIVSGRSKIYGRAKILTGTEVTDDAQVYDDVSIKDSKLSGYAYACKNYKISNQVLDDGYFCNGSENISAGTVSIKSYNEKRINKKKSYITLALNEYNFLNDPNIFRVFINEVLVDNSLISISRNQLIVKDNTLQKDGFNQIRLEGQDEYSKDLSMESIDFYIGSSSREISVTNLENIDESEMKVEVTYHFENEVLLGLGKFKNNKISLEAVPTNGDLYGVTISAVGDKSIIYERYEKISDIPENVESYALPNFINNNTDFSDNLLSWKKTHPNNVKVLEENNKKYIDIEASATDRVIVSKVFQLSEKDAGMQFEYILPQISKLVIDDHYSIQVFLISLKDKKVIIQNNKPFNTSNLKSSLSIPNDTKGGKYAIVIRIEPSSSLSRSVYNYRLLKADISDGIVVFKPYQFTALNKFNTSAIPSTFNTPSNVVDCSNIKYDLANPQNTSSSDVERVIDGIEHFSAGDLYDLGQYVTVNRIYGTFNLKGIEKSQIKAITLLIMQNDTVVKEQSLAHCAQKKLDQSTDLSFFSKVNESLVGYLFPISFPINIPFQGPGSKVRLYLKITLNDEHSTIKLSNPTDLKVLIVPQIPESRWYGAKIDTYDVSERQYLRTGGDKWVLPIFKTILEQMLDLSPQWRINDLAKLNGGQFEFHKGHRTGGEADLTFYDSQSMFNLSEYSRMNVSNERWQKLWDIIENFILAHERWFDITENFFITLQQTIKDKNGNDKSVLPGPIKSRFHYRCIGQEQTRYIDLEEGRDAGFSLFNHSDGHYDHLHLNLNPVTELGLAKSILPVKPQYDLDSLWYEFNENGSLKVSMKQPNSFPDKIRVLYRYQPMEKFDKVSASIQYGKVVKGSQKENAELELVKAEDIMWLHVVFADKENGGCVGRKVKINNTSKRKNKWTYNVREWGYEEVI